VREGEDDNLTLFSSNGNERGVLARIDKAAEIAAHPVSASALDNAVRRYGLEGEDAFLALASHYLQALGLRLPPKSFFPLERGLAVLDTVSHDRQVLVLLDRIVENDRHGSELPVWYQYFLGRRFREGSGKFFTPKTVASSMARLLPLKPNAVVMDPTCGGGTFLAAASRCWNSVPCRLVGNDIDKMLVGLTEIVLAVSTSPQHTVELQCANLFDCGNEFSKCWGSIDYILANPPFSLSLQRVGIRSRLFELGYQNSDAVFLDLCLQLLVPGGSLVCLLPHSIIVNSEYQQLRAAVESEWDLCGIITLPEGVFYLTANTSTRADIVHLRKKADKSPASSKVYFANAPSVGIPLNSRMSDFGENAVEMIVTDTRVKECVYAQPRA
jgi:SAM-dependent methyltransferase